MKNMLGEAPSSGCNGVRMPLWTEYERCYSVKDESRLENPLDVLADSYGSQLVSQLIHVQLVFLD